MWYVDCDSKSPMASMTMWEREILFLVEFGEETKEDSTAEQQTPFVVVGKCCLFGWFVSASAEMND